MTCKSIIISILIFFLVSCGAVSSYAKPDFTINKEIPIIVSDIDGDEPGVQEKLEHLLLTKGFNVVSKSYLGDLDKSSKGGMYFSVDDQKSYEIQLNFTYYYDVFYYAFKSFSARVVDRDTNKIVITANFSGDKSVTAVLNEFMIELEKYFIDS